MKIETILSPLLFNQIDLLKNKAVVIIDILRATSTISTILNNGALCVIPVSEETEALKYKNQDYLIGGERGGETIPGFNFGNSPFDYTKDIVQNKEIVLTTTNGTRCVEMSTHAKTIVIGSFLNLSSVVDYIKKLNLDIVLFCAGWKNRVNLEDSLFAGAFISKCKDAQLDDSSLLCLDLYQSNQDNLYHAMKKSNHFKRLKSKGVENDIKYCCQLDTITCVPIYHDGKIVKAY